jgi:hypothetical protein
MNRPLWSGGCISGDGERRIVPYRRNEHTPGRIPSLAGAWRTTISARADCCNLSTR